MLVITETKPKATKGQASRRRIYHSLPVHLAVGVDKIHGVDYSDGHLVFDRRHHTEESAGLLVRRLKGERLAVRFQGQGRPAQVTAEDLEVINQHSSITLSREDVVVFERYSANDALMRSPLKFTRRALEKFALDFEQGRGVHLDHQDDRGFGRTFAAKVEQATLRGIEANWLILRSYAVTKDATPERLQLIQDVLTGVLPYDSITFLGGAFLFQEVEREDEGTLFFFEVDDDQALHPRLEAVEVSVLSVLGNVYGAGDNLAKNAAGTKAPEPIPTKPPNTQEIILCDF